MSWGGSGVGVFGTLEDSMRLGPIVVEGVALRGDGCCGGSWGQFSFTCTACVAGAPRHGGAAWQAGPGSCYCTTQVASSY